MSRERFGLIIGIDHYQDSNIEPLEYAQKDALEVYSLLTRRGGFHEKNLFLLLGKEAEGKRIRNCLGGFLRKQVRREDLVFLYFAGYGGSEPDPTQQSSDGWCRYLLPFDTSREDFWSTALDFNELARYLNAIPSEELHFFFDCSFKGGKGARSLTLAEDASDAVFEDEFLDPLLGKKGRNLYFASDPNREAYEGAEVQHGIFTYTLLEGLKGGAHKEGDWIHPEGLASYLFSEVRARAKEQKVAQKPHFRGNPSDSLHFFPHPDSDAPEITIQKPSLLDQDKSFEIDPTPFLLGSSSHCHLSIEDLPDQRALIDQCGMRDLKIYSLTGTPIKINGIGYREKILHDRDEIQLASRKLVYLRDSYLSSLDISEKLYKKGEVLKALLLSEDELEKMVDSEELNPIEKHGTRYFSEQELAQIKDALEAQPTMDLDSTLSEISLPHSSHTPHPPEKLEESENPESSPANHQPETSSLAEEARDKGVEESPSPLESGEWGTSWREKMDNGEEVEVFQTKGALTAKSLDTLTDVLAQSGPHLILDFSSLLWINPMGMEVLEKEVAKRNESGATIVVAGLRDRLQEKFDESEILSELPRYEDVEDAKVNFPD